MKVSAHFQQKNGDDPTFEWMQARSGVVTASDFENLVTPLGKIKTGDGPRSYLFRKVAELWSGGPLPAFSSFPMQQGSLLETEAIPFAAVKYDLDIQQVGFVAMDNGRVGCSPDGLIFPGAKFLTDGPTSYIHDPTDSGIEIKCPMLETHIRYLLDGEVPAQYVAQVQGCMYVTGCATWHFLSYRRGLPPLHLIVERDEKYQDALHMAIESFLHALDDAMQALERINGGPPIRKPIFQPKPAVSEYTSGDDVPH